MATIKVLYVILPTSYRNPWELDTYKCSPVKIKLWKQPIDDAEKISPKEESGLSNFLKIEITEYYLLSCVRRIVQSVHGRAQCTTASASNFVQLKFKKQH